MAIGERIVVILHAPAHDPLGRDLAYLFRCESRVIRVEPLESGYGIACRIDDYSLWRAGDPNPAAMNNEPAEPPPLSD
jgi:hypothetical protein